MSKQTDELERMRDLSSEEIGGALVRAREELFRMKMANHTKQLENPLQLRFKRREVAQLLTIMRGREEGKEVQGQKRAAGKES